jgi:glycosyltransferase involved in cell wall biosynthesis
MTPVIGLIATWPRIEHLRSSAIPSIARQVRMPDALVLVSDRKKLPDADLLSLQVTLPQLEICSLLNARLAGVAGAWNTGLHYINQRWPGAYVAMLDDDDAWDRDHLTTCMDAAARSGGPDVVVSGVRMRHAGKVIYRPPPEALSPDDFLVGNPGWQGSNTFAQIRTVLAAGGFTDGLTSCNDRDLAIRILSLPDVGVCYTGRFTATWNFNASPDSLSRAGPQKRAALRHFLAIHGHRMNEKIRRRFLNRCADLFGVVEEELV